MGRRTLSYRPSPILITDSPSDENISIILNGIESELKFITDSKGDKVCIRQQVKAGYGELMRWIFQDQIDGCDGFLVIYSVVDKASFTRAEYFLSLLQDMDLLRSRCCILVGNKIDLARSRAISSQGKTLIRLLSMYIILKFT